MISETQVDQTVLSQIRQRDSVALTAIYKEVYPMVRKHVLANNGSEDDARDVFQDSFYILIKKVQDEDFTLTSQVSTFLVGVAKKLWLKKLTRTALDEQSLSSDVLVNEMFLDENDEEQIAKVRRMNFGLNNLGEPCRSILVGYYFAQQTMKEIAEQFHYTNEENAKNQKYKCLQRLKKLIFRGDE